jgi:hypothetical protein
MAYIGGDQVLLFGGNTASGMNNETWVYDLSANTWTQKSPVGGVKPSARTAYMDYIGDDQVLLFGGWDYPGTTYNDETWVYDLGDNTWILKSPSSKPSARRSHTMAYIGSDQVLLFGGYSTNGGGGRGALL